MHYFEEKLNVVLAETAAVHTFRHHMEKAISLLRQLDKNDKIYLNGDSFFELTHLIDDINDPSTGFLANVFDPNNPKTKPYYTQITNINLRLKNMLDAYSPRSFNEAINTGHIEVLQDAYERIEETMALASNNVDFKKYPDSKRLINIFIVAIRHVTRALDVMVSFAHDQAHQ